jgi:aminoglycoside phosphotransferase (APT) family kinase protein
MEMDPLATALAALAPRLGGKLAVPPRRLSGGASQETWAFEIEASGATRPLILRKRPDGLTADPSRTAGLAIEAGLIQLADEAGAPVPGVVHVCTPDDGLGEAYVMARVEGETLGRRIVRDAAFAGVRPGLARRCGEVLAAIHAVPMAALPALPRSDPRAELDKYEAIYRQSGAERPIFELAFKRLARAALPEVEPSLVHGDFRNGNLMIHPEHGLAAVLDWELAHIGDPAADLGWLCVNSWRFGGDKPVGGFGDYADLLDGYAAAGGRPIPLERVLYWQTLGSLKWGVMCLIMYGAYASGADPSVERAMIGRRVSETEIDLMNLLGASR